MLRTLVCSLAALVAVSWFASADAHAQNVRRIRWMLVETPCGAANPALTTMVEGDTLPSTFMEVVTGNDKVIPLTAGTLERVVATTAAAGVIGDAGLSVKLEIYGEGGALVHSGIAIVPKGKTSASFTNPSGPGFEVGTLTLRKHLAPGIYGLEVGLLGEGVAKITAVNVLTSNPQPEGPPIGTTTTLLPDALRSQRAFTAPVRFDGDPTGRDYRLRLRVLQPRPNRRPELLARAQVVVAMESVPQSLPCGGGFALQSMPATSDHEAPECCDHIDLDLDVDP